MSPSQTFSIHEQAFLIRSVKYQDEHRILSFLTRHHGRVDLIVYSAQKSQKRFLGILDFLNQVKIEYQGSNLRSLPRLLQTDLLKTYFGLRADETRCFMALEWLQLLGKLLPQGAPISGIFELLDQSLLDLEKQNPLWVDLLFRYYLLSHLGYRLELRHCRRCHRSEGPFRFFTESGGILCSDCQTLSQGLILSQAVPENFWSFQGELFPLLNLELKKILTRSFSEFLGQNPQR